MQPPLLSSLPGVEAVNTTDRQLDAHSGQLEKNFVSNLFTSPGIPEFFLHFETENNRICRKKQTTSERKKGGGCDKEQQMKTKKKKSAHHRSLMYGELRLLTLSLLREIATSNVAKMTR